MKKILPTILTLTTIISLTACNTTTTPDDGISDASSSMSAIMSSSSSSMSVMMDNSSSSAMNGRPLSKEGEFCGGIAAFQCDEGLTCRYDGTYPDAGGVCVVVSE